MAHKRIGYRLYTLDYIFNTGSCYETTSKCQMLIEIDKNVFISCGDFEKLYNRVKPEIKKIEMYTLNYNYIDNKLVALNNTYK